MAHINNKSLFILDADAAPVFDPGTPGGVASVAGTSIFYFHSAGTTWNRIDIGLLSEADGNDTPVIRGNATAGVLPTAGEVASPVAGDTASVFLTDGSLEKYVYNGTVWALAYTLAANEAANLGVANQNANTLDVTSTSGTDATLPAATNALAGLLTADVFNDIVDLITLTGVAGNATDLGTFTGATIPDNQTIKEALQAIETALEAISAPIQTVIDSPAIELRLVGTELQAVIKFSASQNKLYAVSTNADGLTLVKQTVTAYASHAAAAGDAGLAVDEPYCLTVTNINGVPSNGKSPIFYK